jgi:DNA-binding response OmpR family regulator
MERDEATRWIEASAAPRHVPLIAVTSYAPSGDEARALAAGADGYVSKPFSPRALLARVRETLGEGDRQISKSAATGSSKPAAHPRRRAGRPR